MNDNLRSEVEEYFADRQNVPAHVREADCFDEGLRIFSIAHRVGNHDPRREMIEERGFQMLILHLAGLSYAQIGRAHGLSKSRVYQLVSEIKEYLRANPI